MTVTTPGTPPSSSSSSAPQHRLLGLEVLRFLCAFAVLVWHYQHFGFEGDHLRIVRAEQPFYAWLKPLYEHGYLGVQVFWCISGFIFFWKYGRSIAERRVSGRRFFVLRFSRLYPLHLATLVLVLALQGVYQALHGHAFVYQHNDVVHLIRQLLMASNWIDGPEDESFNGPVWSISVEVLVYAIFFVLLRCCGPSLRSAAVVTLLGLGGLLAHLAWPVFACAAYFYAGGLAALVLAQRPARERRLAGLALAALAVVWTVHRFAPAETTGALLVAGVPLLLCMLALSLRQVPEPVARSIETVGNLTYASYLLHFPLQLAVVLLCGALHWPVPVHSGLFFAAFIAAVFALSALVYRRFEMPMQSLIRRLALR